MQSIRKNNSMKSTLNAMSGITLIALVVTIVVLLILASVSITVVFGDNGILQLAKEAGEKTKLTSEKEVLQVSVASYQLGKFSGNKEELLGKSLLDKELKNSSTWDIVVEKTGDKNSYGTGWNFLEKGTELKGYGKAEHSFLINYETGEIKQLEEDNYIRLSAGDMLAVKDDSLIINIDSSIVDTDIEPTKENLEKQFGEGVELHGFDLENPSENSGLTNKSFNFDGEDDWIEVNYDNKERKDELIEKGFTFEFYGDTTKALFVYDVGNGEVEKKTTSTGGGFGWWNGDEKDYADLHFNLLRNGNELGVVWTAGVKGNERYPEIGPSDREVWGVSGNSDGSRFGMERNGRS